MPEVEYRTTMSVPPTVVWEFVKDFNHWAPMLTGYQKHVVESETDSIWTLKGDVGILSRTVQLRAHVTEWNGPERVTFTLTGLNEQVDGGGTLEMSACSDEAPAASVGVVKIGLFARLVRWVFRLMFRVMHGKGPARAPATGKPASQLTFRLRMDALGPTGPLVNAMLGPALLPAAEDLANKIAAHLEAAQAGQPAIAARAA
jgi:carbon monoxide dehydrogenase subunit G